MTTSNSVEHLKAPYIAFTRTWDKNRPPEVRVNELINLAEDPDVASIGFAKGNVYTDFKKDGEDAIDWLLIGTPYITINHGGKIYGVGQFIVYFSRFRPDNSADTQFFVQNVTPTGPLGGPCIRHHPTDSFGTTRTTINQHPHCNNGEIATFCMSDGKNELMLALQDGVMPKAYRYVLSALKSYGPDKPLVDIKLWPEYIERNF